MNSLPVVSFDDQVIECAAAFDDPCDYDSPDDWPSEWDNDSWELGPEDDPADEPRPTFEEPAYEPTPDDLREMAEMFGQWDAERREAQIADTEWADRMEREEFERRRERLVPDEFFEPRIAAGAVD